MDCRASHACMYYVCSRVCLRRGKKRQVHAGTEVVSLPSRPSVSEGDLRGVSYLGVSILRDTSVRTSLLPSYFPSYLHLTLPRLPSSNNRTTYSCTAYGRVLTNRLPLSWAPTLPPVNRILPSPVYRRYQGSHILTHQRSTNAPPCWSHDAVLPPYDEI